MEISLENLYVDLKVVLKGKNYSTILLVVFMHHTSRF